MLTYADDHRIMTDLDMSNCEDLSSISWEKGATPREVRLMACMRLLLANIECRTEKTSKGVKPERMWINQPSRLQPYHNLHGVRVLAIHEYDETWQIFFLGGDVVSQQIDQAALSKGWK